MRSIIAAAALTLLCAPVASAQSHLLVIAGLSGEPRLQQEFHAWSSLMVDAASQRSGMSADRITYLAEKPERDRARIDGESTKANIDAAIRRIAGVAGPGDRVMILVIGHGSAEGEEPRINLPGPDMTAAEFAAMLDRFTTQPVVVVNATSSSGAFQEPLAGRNRTVITATNSGREQNETVFARYFVNAFADEGADVDKDGRVTVLEAYEFANTEVERFYAADNRLQTEHSVLGGNREVARTFTLGGGARAAATSSDPELRALLEQRQALEDRVQALRARKDAMEPAAYDRELSALLLELARKTREIRAKEGGTE